MNHIAKIAAIVLTIALCGTANLHCEEIPIVDWERLSDKDITPQGKAALSSSEKPWKHAETRHFIYHFTDEKEAETVYVHAETYYGWIKDLFGIGEDTWAKKSHIFVFSDEKEWENFKTRANVKGDPAAFTTGWELFIYRKPYWLAPAKTLAHEITHIIIFRFLGGPVPLFLNEGFSEFVSYRAIALKSDGNEFKFRVVKLIEPDKFIPLTGLIAMDSYPEDDIALFYQESELVVRFLILNYDSKKFYKLLDDVSKGDSFKNALSKIYETDFDSFDQKFREYAIIRK